jgi:hypothetical protein
LRQALFDGLGGDLVREGADRELVVAEDVTVQSPYGTEFAPRHVE